MKCRNGIISVFVVLVALLASAQGAEPVKGRGGPPEIGAALAVDGNAIQVSRFIRRSVTRTTTSDKPVIVSNSKGSISVDDTETVSVVETQTMRYDAAELTVIRVDGQAVQPKDFAKHFSKSMPVLLANAGEEVNQKFLAMFEPESLILTPRVSTEVRTPDASLRPIGVQKTPATAPGRKTRR